MQVRWTEPAAQDLEGISEYIRKDRPAAAQTIAKALFDAANSLSGFPAKGRNGRIPGTHELVVTGRPYIIVYRITDAAVHILRIYHAAREWPEEL